MKKVSARKTPATFCCYYLRGRTEAYVTVPGSVVAHSRKVKGE